LGVQLHALLMSQPVTLSGPSAVLAGKNLVVSVGQEGGWPPDRLDAVVKRNTCCPVRGSPYSWHRHFTD
jgi:hypothetical protein